MSTGLPSLAFLDLGLLRWNFHVHNTYLGGTSNIPQLSQCGVHFFYYLFEVLSVSVSGWVCLFPLESFRIMLSGCSIQLVRDSSHYFRLVICGLRFSGVLKFPYNSSIFIILTVSYSSILI